MQLFLVEGCHIAGLPLCIKPEFEIQENAKLKTWKDKPPCSACDLQGLGDGDQIDLFLAIRLQLDLVDAVQE